MFMGLKHFRNILIPPIETSSVKNVNVDTVFHTITNMCIGCHRDVQKPLAYGEASNLVEQRNLQIK